MNYSDLIVIGAGVSGLVLANEMKRAGQSVTVLEKARGSGGRLSSKRCPLDGGGQITFDLGCPSFTAKSDSFKAYLNDELAQVGSLGEGVDTRYFATPRNSILTRQLADQLDVHFAHRVTGIEQTENGWTVTSEHADGAAYGWQCGRLVVSAPPEQAAALIPATHSAQSVLTDAYVEPQWVVSFAFEENEPSRSAFQPLAEHVDVLKVSVENDKSGRDYPPGLAVCVIHFTSAWTKQSLDWSKESVQSYALEALCAALSSAPLVKAAHTHRWLYSLPAAQSKGPLDEALGYFLDETGLALCGDHLASDECEGVERAWLSAMALASALKDKIGLENELAEAAANGV